ncbi:MAG: hypothetical protein JWO32_714 [Bacteroidetes bacterium]|nr:hypothetical protein [Bacteroidota bacterium]
MKKILIPTDFTSLANNALNYSLALASILKCEVIILHADQPNPKALSALMEEVNSIAGAARNYTITYLTTPKQFSSIIINELVVKNKIDLIVMGTSGQDLSLEKELFGTNAADIAEHARCPVICVPASYTHAGIKKIAFAADLNFINKQAAPVINFAKELSLPLHLFHVVPVFPDLGDTEKMNVNARTDQLKIKHNYSEIYYAVETTKHDNEILKGIIAFISHNEADLLVMFHDHLSALDEFFNKSNVEKVLSHIQIPLMVFPQN